MADFTKIIDHPEKTTIVSKLCSGESPKVVAKYLKDKYPKPDESHLRIPATVLQEFLETYADHHGYVKKIIQKDTDNKLDKKIAESLLDTRAWRERVLDGVDKEIKYIDRLDNILTILETRTEQLFDLIQSDPESIKIDYVFTKYMEILLMAIEKGDKIRNDRPDVRIEHTYTVQMVEQYSVAFQEAIRRAFERLGPESSALFMELLKEEIDKVNPKELSPVPTQKSIEKERLAFDKLEVKAQELNEQFDAEFEEEADDTEEEDEFE
jgi:hypothetical protein